MSGVSPYAYMQQVAVELHTIHSVRQLETVLDELEFLYDVIAPDLQDQADEIMAQVRNRLDSLR